jgi:hypothetical protein
MNTAISKTYIGKPTKFNAAFSPSGDRYLKQLKRREQHFENKASLVLLQIVQLEQRNKTQ